MRTVSNRRGSVFYRCGRADDDPKFPRYPALPVLTCAGYEREGRDHLGPASKALRPVPGDL